MIFDPPPLNPPSAALLAELTAIVGAGNALSSPDDQAAYLTEWRGKYHGRTPLVLRPGSTQDVSKILKLCNAARVGVVPQSGNTGLVGGQIPSEQGTEIVLSLKRLDKIRTLDAVSRAITVEAGVTLARVQEAASEAGFLYPLSMASEGSCCIGGNLATNAGGVGVLAYGSARSHVLGLEAVLADGRIWQGLKSLTKDNTAYDLKSLLPGSEGTLGIITAATLKLFSKPRDQAVAFLSISSLADLTAIFRLAMETCGPLVTAFEFMSARALDFSVRHGGGRNPSTSDAPWFVLLELSTSQESGAAAAMEQFLAELYDRGLVLDARIAASLTQAQEFWALRENISAAQKPEGGSIKHDISVPVAAIPQFVEDANALVERMIPGARPVVFGHFGDGNIHYNVSQPVGADTPAFLKRWDELSHAVHDLVAQVDGSISAEHGIGQMKRDELRMRKSPVELDMMRAIKRALDPNGILNPGKVL